MGNAHNEPDLKGKRMAIRAVMFDFGGVVTTSPFEAFARLEAERGLPAGFIRTVNATNPDENAWARLERSELTSTFAAARAAEAQVLGYELDGRLVLERLSGDIRPRMVAAIDAAGGLEDSVPHQEFPVSERARLLKVAEVNALFDAVLESRVLGVRKPDPPFHELACTALGVQPQESASSTTSASTSSRPLPPACTPSRRPTPTMRSASWAEKLLGHPVVNALRHRHDN